MILKNISILYGNDLKFIEQTNVLITNNTFQKIASKIKPAKNKVVNCDGLLLIPGLINSHTHIGDSIAKDVALDRILILKSILFLGLSKKFSEKQSQKNWLTL